MYAIHYAIHGGYGKHLLHIISIRNDYPSFLHMRNLELKDRQLLL